MSLTVQREPPGRSTDVPGERLGVKPGSQSLTPATHIDGAVSHRPRNDSTSRGVVGRQRRVRRLDRLDQPAERCQCRLMERITFRPRHLRRQGSEHDVIVRPMIDGEKDVPLDQ